MAIGGKTKLQNGSSNALVQRDGEFRCSNLIGESSMLSNESVQSRLRSKEMVDYPSSLQRLP